MAAYAYPIAIKRTPQRVSYHREYNTPDIFTFDWIRSHVANDEHFNIYDDKVIVYGTRYETPDEVKKRVEREEAYMKEYNRRKGTK